MEVGTPRVTPWSLSALVFIVTVCVTPMCLDRTFIAETGPSLLTWLLLAICTAGIGYYLQMRVTMPQNQAWLPMRILFALFYAVGAGMMLNAWLTVIALIDLPVSPRMIVAALSLMPAIYVLRLGIEAVARLTTFIALIALPTLVLLVIGASTAMHISELMPRPLGFTGVPGIWPVILFAPRGFVILNAFAQDCREQHVRYVLAGAAAAALLLLVALIMPVLVYGRAPATMMTFPTLRAIGTISSSYLVVQRIAFLSSVIWQMIITVVMASYGIASIRAIGLPVRALIDWKALAVLAGVIGAVAYPELPEDQYAALIGVWSLLGLFLFIVRPLGILALRLLQLRPEWASP